MDNFITGDALSRYMNEKNLSLEQVAATIGVSAATISRWKQGKFIDRISTQQKLKEFMGENDAPLQQNFVPSLTPTQEFPDDSKRLINASTEAFVSSFIRERVKNEKLGFEEYDHLRATLTASVSYDPASDSVFIKRETALQKEFAKYVIDEESDGVRIMFVKDNTLF